MTNEEKAQEMSEGAFEYLPCESTLPFYLTALEIAEWKDIQFKEHLTEKLKRYKESIHTPTDQYDLGYMDAIKEVINEIFGE